jgi:inorganic pyrophosphatase
MTMVDTGKRDHKILAVAEGDPEFNVFTASSELPPHRLTMLQLEGKAVEVDEIQSANVAIPVIENSLERYSQLRRKGFK